MWLYILLGVLVLLVFLLIMPIRLRASYEDSAFVSVSYLFLKFQLLPKKPKKDKKKAGKKGMKSKAEAQPDTKPKKKLSEKLREVSDGVSLAADAAGRLIKSIKIKKLYLNIDIGTPDAADTAIEYGAVSAVLYPVCGLIFSRCRVDEKKFKANINARYDLEESGVSFKADISISLISAIVIAVLTLCKYISKITENNKDNELIKGGAVK